MTASRTVLAAPATALLISGCAPPKVERWEGSPEYTPPKEYKVAVDQPLVFGDFDAGSEVALREARKTCGLPNATAEELQFDWLASDFSYRTFGFTCPKRGKEN